MAAARPKLVVLSEVARRLPGITPAQIALLLHNAIAGCPAFAALPNDVTDDAALVRIAHDLFRDATAERAQVWRQTL